MRVWAKVLTTEKLVCTASKCDGEVAYDFRIKLEVMNWIPWADDVRSDTSDEEEDADDYYLSCLQTPHGIPDDNAAALLGISAGIRPPNDQSNQQSARLTQSVLGNRSFLHPTLNSVR